MGENRSNRFSVFRVVVVFTSGSLAGCSVLPEQTAPDSALPIYRIAGAVTAGAGRPEIADSKPATEQGELRFVVVPRGQTVGGTVRARRNSRQAASASDDALYQKKKNTIGVKVSAPATTVGEASREVKPLN